MSNCQVAVVLALPSSDCQLVLAGTGAFRPGPPDEVLDKLRPSISVCDHLQRAIRPNCVPEYIERMTTEREYETIGKIFDKKSWYHGKVFGVCEKASTL